MNKQNTLKSLMRNTKSTNKIKTTNINFEKKQKHIKETKLKDISESESSESNNNIDIRLNDLIYPCKDIILFTRVILHPHQMNNDLYINLKKNLIDKIEGKCIKDGYIIKIYKILEYTNGIIEPENFTGSAIYDIKFLAKICMALKESIILAKITSYIPNANFALAEFGTIIKIIFTKNKRDLNTNIFQISNDKSILHIPTQKKIGLNDWVKVQLKSIKFYQNDTTIKCMAYLEDIATQDDIDKYAYKDDDIKSNNIINYDNQLTIYFNEDNEQENINIEQSLINNQTDILESKIKNNKMDI